MRDKGAHGCKAALAFVVRGWGYPLRFIGGTEMGPKPPPFHLCSAGGSERIALLESGKKITKANDNLFELDKNDDGKFVCVKCWKLKHTASRCTSSNKKKAKSDK